MFIFVVKSDLSSEKVKNKYKEKMNLYY